MKSPEAIRPNGERPGRAVSLPAPSLWWRRPAGTAARATAALLLAGGAAFLTDTIPQISFAVSSDNNHQIQTVSDAPPNPIYFDSSLGPRRWYFDNFTWGIPPNNTERNVATVDDDVNGIHSGYFQSYEIDYPETQEGYWISLKIGGAIADSLAEKALMLTAVWQQGNRYLPRVEGIQNTNTPTDHAGRKVYQDVLPQEGTMGDSFSSVDWHTDDQGKSLDIGLKNSITPSNDGLWRCALNNYYEIIGKCVKVVTQPFRVFFPLIQRPA